MPKMKIALPHGSMIERIQALNDSRNAGKIQAKDTGDVLNVDLYGEIGHFGVSAAAFRQVMMGAGDIHLRINSPGGDVLDGIAIYNDLVDHPGKVTITVSGIAASAASVIAMAADELRMHSSDRLMIHNAWALTMGNRHELRQLAEILDGVDADLARIYANRSGVGVRAIVQMMDAETWIRGKDAVDQGFADALVGSADVKAKAQWNLGAFKNAPEDLLGEPGEEDPHKELTIRDIERALRDVGASRKQAQEMAAKLKPGALRDAGNEPSATLREEEIEQRKDAIKQFIFELNVFNTTM